MISLLHRVFVPFTLLLGLVACGTGGSGVLIGSPPGVDPDDDDDAVDDDDAADDDDAVVGPFADFVLNEVISSGDDVIEIINREPTEQDLGGWSLNDDNDGGRWVIPEGTMVPAGGIIHFIKDEHDIGLGDEDAARLYDPAGQLVDTSEYNEGAASLSWCRFPDGSGSWTICTRPTPGLPNIIESVNASVDPLYIAGLDRVADPDVRIAEPNELSFDDNGLLWAGDQENLRVQIFNFDGSFLASVGGVGDGPGQFAFSNSSNRGPESMKPGPDGNMYVVDRIGDRVNVYDMDTFEARPSIAGDSDLVDPTGLAVSSVGLVYVGDQSRNVIDVFNLNGDYRATFQTHDSSNQPILRKVETLTIDEEADRLFATSENEQRVEVYRLSTGEYLEQHVTQLQGGGGIEPGRISVSIEGIFLDPVNRWLFICDEEAGRYMLHDVDSPSLVDPLADFAFLGAFGSVGTAPGELRSPDGVTVSHEYDRLAIADQGNDRVQVWALSDIAEALSLTLAP